MICKSLLLLFFFTLSLWALDQERLKIDEDGLEIVIETKRLNFSDFPDAHNPSILRFGEYYLLCFRYIPNIYQNPWVSYIILVLLNENLDPISIPQVVSTRTKESKSPSQSEDARLFSYRGRIFLIYNDNIDEVWAWGRRDMFITELFYENQRFSLSTPLKLIHKEKYFFQIMQKNWVPFEWNKMLFVTYTVHPHEVLYINLMNGDCYPYYVTSPPIHWHFGSLRGGAPPQLIDGEFLAFFHSASIIASPASLNQQMWHYFMGAYTFSAEPPFEITKITPVPILHDTFYTHSSYYKRVVFPGGFVDAGPVIYVAYGKDDREIWIATIDKVALKKALKSI
jgi:predicted GH43/DUF377 family glycosyl hydrolase